MTNIVEFIDSELYELANIFGDKTPLYIVGGFVRDSIEFNKKPEDIDLAAACTPTEVENLLKNTRFKAFEASARLGTLIIKGKRAYEYTSFRLDSYPKGSGEHSPSEVKFTKDINLDAKRRDFKCNSVYFELITNKIVDPLNGIDEIQKKKISTTIDPEIVLSQDGLRILRLIRLVAVLGYEVEEKTLEAATKLKERLKDISVERIQAEIKKILNGDHVFKALCLMRDIGALEIIFPDLQLGHKMAQNPKYHKYDVLEHIFKTVEAAPKKIRLAALLHDVAKPYCMLNHGNMYLHADVGAKMAQKILEKYKFSNEEIKMVVELVGAHMFDLNDTAKPFTIRKFISKHYQYIEDIVDLQIADAIATGLISGPLRESRTRKQIAIMKERKIPFTIKQLEINGDDLIKIGFKGKIIGQLLQEMFDVCLCENVKNEKEELVSYATKKWRKLYGNSNISN